MTRVIHRTSFSVIMTQVLVQLRLTTSTTLEMSLKKVQ